MTEELPETIDDFDLTNTFFFSGKYAEEWEERRAYKFGLKKGEKEFLQPTNKILVFFKDELKADFFREPKSYKDPTEEIITHFPESKIGQLYAGAFGYSNDYCDCCGAKGMFFVKPLTHHLCETCHKVVTNDSDQEWRDGSEGVFKFL